MYTFYHSCHKFYNIHNKKNNVLELYVCAEGKKNKLCAHKQKCIYSECIAYLHLCVKMLFTFLQLPTYIYCVNIVTMHLFKTWENSCAYKFETWRWQKKREMAITCYKVCIMCY